MATDPPNQSQLTTLPKDHKRWCVFGIALNYVVVPAIRPVLEKEILKEYNDLKLNHSIHVQTAHSLPSPKYPTGNAMKYENINGNDTKLKPPHYKKFDYSRFDYKVTSHVDFGKLFLQNYMAKLNAFDESCDASAVLNLLGKIPVFSAALKNAANVVKESRNTWGHCNFTKWDESNFKKSFDDMEKLLREVGLSLAVETKILANLNDWKDKGVALCMNATIDWELVKVVQEHVTKLSSDVHKMAFESQEEMHKLKEMLENTREYLQDCQKRFENIEYAQNIMQQELSSTAANVNQLETEQEVLQQEQSFTSAKVDQLTTNQRVLQQEQSLSTVKVHQLTTYQEALQQEQSSTSVKVDQLTTNQEVLQQEQSSTTVKVDQLTTNQEVLQQEQNSTSVKVDQLRTNQEVLQQEQSSTSAKVGILQGRHEAVQQRVTKLESRPDIFYGFSDCTSDIEYFAGRYDPDTRHWLLKDFNTWFSKPGNSRAYVLLGDAAVGKSVMAAVIAQRAKNDGNMAAAYFCRHYDGTRRDPRYLLATIAYQLCYSNSQYDRIIGGENRIQNMLANAKLGVHELFTKLLEEPLSKCSPIAKQLVVIDALDEAEYWSREDFLDLIMIRFPILPKWLVFFITSRPENTVQFRLKKYNPCIRICAGSSEGIEFYQQHKQDIQRFLEKNVNFISLSYTAEELAEKCDGMFLYAFFFAEMLQTSPQMDGDILPENFNHFLLKNFKRVKGKVGEIFYSKLFGCALVAPSPLPISFISFLLQKENSSLNEQEVIDAVSLFVALRTSDQTFAFLHNLIPVWLTDKKKSMDSFINRNIANEYFRSIIDGFLNDFLDARSTHFSSDKPDLVNYALITGFRFLCRSVADISEDSETVFKCLTNYRFLQQRIRSSKIGIYSVLEDLMFSAENIVFDQSRKNILKAIFLVLERDLFILPYSPDLLDSCLLNASKLVQEQVMYKEVSACMMVTSVTQDNPFSPPAFLRSMQCCAFSSNNLLAVGNKQGLSLYNVCPLTKIFGPIELMNENVSYLTFSPDNKFVFFGKLDLWFSVEDRRVIKIPQFSGNSRRYEWGSFICAGKYIAVHGKLYERHSNECLSHLFLTWLDYEYRFPLSVTEPRTLLAYSKLLGLILRSLPDTRSHLSLYCHSKILSKLCPLCSEFKKLSTHVPDRVIHLYADVFEYQIWNVETGRSVLEELFSMQSNCEDFFYIWHHFPTIKDLAKDIEIGRLQIAPFFLDSDSNDFLFDCLIRMIKGLPSFETAKLERFRLCNFEDRVENIFVDCQHHLFGSRGAFGDGKWTLVEKNGDEGTELHKKLGPHYYSSEFKNVQNYAFSRDRKLFLYITRPPNQRLHCILLETGFKALQSLFGSFPILLTHEDSQDIGFIFCGDSEKKDVLLSDLPPEFLVSLFSCEIISMPANIINVTFASPDEIACVSVDGICTRFKVSAGELVQVVDVNIMRNEDSQLNSVKQCIFSHDGKLIAIHRGGEISLFNTDKFLCCVYKLTEMENTVVCLTFSSDDSLLLFCVEKAKNEQSFYVFDIKIGALNDPIILASSPYDFEMSVDCCSFSSNNSELFFCNVSSVLILQFPIENPRYRKVALPYGSSKPFEKCGYCTVSSNNTFLACCITNKILIHPLNSQDRVWELPQNHIGMIEGCKFLKDNRYLISYGIDGLIFLFDLFEWNSIAYVKRENIISMAVSSDEDKIVCLQLSGEISFVKLRGLKIGLPSDFQLPSKYREKGKGRLVM